MSKERSTIVSPWSVIDVSYEDTTKSIKELLHMWDKEKFWKIFYLDEDLMKKIKSTIMWMKQERRQLIVTFFLVTKCVVFLSILRFEYIKNAWCCLMWFMSWWLQDNWCCLGFFKEFWWWWSLARWLIDGNLWMAVGWMILKYLHFIN